MIKKRAPRHPRGAQDILVELATAKGMLFSGAVSAVQLSPSKNLVQLKPGKVIYSGLMDSGQVALRIGSHYYSFALVNALVGIRGRRLTVLAEIIRPTAAAPSQPR
jgi:hypothetical protein